LSYSTSPFSCGGFLQDRVLGIICLGWFQTSILLIAASSVVRIPSMTHQRPASSDFCQAPLR
jgi:hypothetical protein